MQIVQQRHSPLWSQSQGEAVEAKPSETASKPTLIIRVCVVCLFWRWCQTLSGSLAPILNPAQPMQCKE